MTEVDISCRWSIFLVFWNLKFDLVEEILGVLIVLLVCNDFDGGKRSLYDFCTILVVCIVFTVLNCILLSLLNLSSLLFDVCLLSILILSY